jgi:plasmid maintenance system antidote protein VapI
MYFSSIFIRWQRSHQLSDKIAQYKLGLTACEFNQFREDELTITQDLINKLAEVTGASRQFWQNRWEQQKKKQQEE